MTKTEDYVELESSPISDAKILVTGSSSGIGRELALSLNRLGGDVYVHGRDVDRTREVVAKMQEQTDSNSTFYCSDFSKFEQVRELASWIAEQVGELDYLVNNAGGYYTASETSEDGYEMNYAVNFASHFLLTLLLINEDVLCDDGRIINVSSEAHHNCDGISFNRLKVGESDWQAYCTSKACQVMFTKTLSSKLSESEMTVSSVHPGSIPSTRISRNSSKFVSSLSTIPEYIPLLGVRNKSQGASTLLHAMLLGQESGDGGYYVNFEDSQPAEFVQDTQLADELWSFTRNVVEEKLR